MSCISDKVKRKQKRKTIFRYGKYFFPLWLCVFPVMATDFQQQLHDDAQHRLSHYAKQARWPRYTSNIAVWLPSNTDQLTPCQQALHIEPAQLNQPPWGRIPYTLSCSQPQWELRGRVEVEVRLPVWVANHNISRGTVLSADNLRRRTLAIDKLFSGFYTDRQQLIGKQAQRSVRAGQVLTPRQLSALLLVNKGDQVVIKVHGEGVSASMTGTALENGSQGDSVKVRNDSSGKLITAWVVSQGVVETHF